MVKFKNFKFKSQVFWSLVIIWNSALGFCNFSTAFAQDKIVAVVNDEIITQKDLNDFVNFMRMQLSVELTGEQLEQKIQSMKADLLNKLIEDRLILQEAKKNKVSIDENRVKAKIDEIKGRYGREAEFQAALVQQGLTQADLELRLREQLLMYSIIEAKIKSKIIIRPSEVTEFYQENIEEFKTPEEREFQSLTTNDGDLAQKIYDDLKKGGDFSETAKKYSLEAKSFNAKQGGELRAELEGAIFLLNPGEISEPLKIEDSFYIFKLIKIIPFRQKSLIETQDKIQEFVFNKKMQEDLLLWLTELKKNAYIKISTD